ncbi:MutS-related protein [Pseudoduganella rivuli]|nr:DNA mismatch repair protein MutS [Pseudoduganella rivuli]
MMKLLKLLMGYEAPAIDFPFPRTDVAMYGQLQGGAAHIDGQTWDELQLDAYLERVAQGCSIFGRQALYRRLLGGQDAAYARVRALADDGAAFDALTDACRGLRAVDTEVAQMLFGPEPARSPRWSGALALLPVALMLSVLLAFVWGPGWIAALALWVVLMGVQVAWYVRAQAWGRQVAALQQLLRAHSMLGGLPADSAGAPYVAALRPGARDAGRASRVLGRSPLQMLPGVSEYSEWMLLANIRHYFNSRNAFVDRLAALRDSYRLVAELEADLALARHVREAPVVCAVEVSDAVVLDSVVHPLVADAHPLSVDVRGSGAFISGQNGVGKSTLLRTVGLNLVAARAFGFCYAQCAQAPLLPVYASMQNEDSLADGESLYISELRRARELLALAAQGRTVFLIDEIFRGTNHVESVSAAAAVLDELARHGMVIVSSHNVVLAPLLAHALSPLCVEPDAHGRLHVRSGVLARTNGIALLSQHGFGDAIDARAHKVHAWLSSHLAHPQNCDGVLTS